MPFAYKFRMFRSIGQVKRFLITSFKGVMEIKCQQIRNATATERRPFRRYYDDRGSWRYCNATKQGSP